MLNLTHESGARGEAVGVVLGDFWVDVEVHSPSVIVLEVNEVGVVQHLGYDNTSFRTENLEVR